MNSKNPKTQTNEEIIETLLANDKHQYTEAAHAEIFNRLIKTISDFNNKAEKTEKVILVLALSQVILAVAQVVLAYFQLK